MRAALGPHCDSVYLFRVSKMKVTFYARERGSLEGSSVQHTEHVGHRQWLQFVKDPFYKPEMTYSDVTL